jgi:DNA-binding response OmpR family regulator
MLHEVKPIRILIIEDEPMLAVDLEETLTEAGFEVVGIVGRLDKAFALIRTCGCDAAIVDANLAGVSAGPAARALAERGIPFVVLSGYALEQQRDKSLGANYLQKPCRPAQLISSLTALVGG